MRSWVWIFTPIKGHNINVKSQNGQSTKTITKSFSGSGSSLLQLHFIAFSPFVVYDFYNLSSQVQRLKMTLYLKITKKVSFSSASEASYVYNLRGQTFTKNIKNDLIWRFLKTWSLRWNSVTRQVTFHKTKSGGKC